MSSWRRPSSPIACRAALMRLVSADSLTNRLPHTVSSSSSFGDDAVSFADQQRKHVEHLGLDPFLLPGPAQPEPGQVELALAERVDHATPPPPLVGGATTIAAAVHPVSRRMSPGDLQVPSKLPAVGWLADAWRRARRRARLPQATTTDRFATEFADVRRGAGVRAGPATAHGRRGPRTGRAGPPPDAGPR